MTRSTGRFNKSSKSQIIPNQDNPIFASGVSVTRISTSLSGPSSPREKLPKSQAFSIGLVLKNSRTLLMIEVSISLFMLISRRKGTRKKWKLQILGIENTHYYIIYVSRMGNGRRKDETSGRKKNPATKA